MGAEQKYSSIRHEHSAKPAHAGIKLLNLLIQLMNQSSHTKSPVSTSPVTDLTPKHLVSQSILQMEPLILNQGNLS